MRPGCRAAILAACLAAAPIPFLAGGADQDAAPPGEGGARSWSENFDFGVEIDGKPIQGARLYNARGRSAVLVLLDDGQQAWVIDTALRQVLAADPRAIRQEPEGDLRLDDAAIGGDPAPFTLDRETVVFFQGGKRYRLARRPPLLGEVTADALIAQIPAYRKGMEAYTPAPQDIFYLKGFSDPVRIEIYFGSWCPHCRIVVPRFLKSIQEASNANLQCVYTGVPTPFSDYPPARDRQVRGVPTFIVYAGDREIGRIGAFNADSSVEHELVKILYQWKQSRG